MYKHFQFIFFLFLISFCSIVYGQDLSFYKSAADSIVPVDKISSRSYILVPSVLIAIGATFSGIKGFKNINYGLKEEIWDDNFHRQTQADNYLQWAPAITVYGLNTFGDNGKHNFADRTIIYGLSTLIMSTSVFIIKRSSSEQRPDSSDNYSFPSGHTATAFAAAEFLRLEYKDKSPSYGIGGYAIAAATGYLRLYNNKHWLGDVLTGAGVGILSTDIAYRLYPFFKNTIFKKNKGSAIIMPFYQNGITGITLVENF